MHRNCPWKSRSSSGRFSSKGHARELPRSTKTGRPRCGVWRKLIELRAVAQRHVRHPRTVQKSVSCEAWQLQAPVDSLRAVLVADRQGPNPERVCHRDVRVDGAATEGLASGGCGRASRGSGDDFSNLLTKAAAERQEIIQEQLRGALGEGRFGPILSVHSGALCTTRDGENVRQGATNCCVVRVNAKYGLRGVRIGEAAHPRPDSRRHRAQRLRALRWSWERRRIR